MQAAFVGIVYTVCGADGSGCIASQTWGVQTSAYGGMEL
jgi:hypothetical protein